MEEHGIISFPNGTKISLAFRPVIIFGILIIGVLFVLMYNKIIDIWQFITIFAIITSYILSMCLFTLITLIKKHG